MVHPVIDNGMGVGGSIASSSPLILLPVRYGLGGSAAARFPLHLVSSQPQHKLHSQMDAGPVSARAKTAGRETLAINPVDAREHGIGDGEVVRVFNDRGACFAEVVVTDAVRPGVVRLSCGACMTPRAMPTMRPARMATRMY
jgi:biotin/methionine sulfoxide reductase